ncbi:hypothetical protein AB0392_34845 [Nonomuraea angiospora]|uniref:hypothetical protein n=1 Tax=Nonomuraea angiospora TaxID=46172 RepID=UPI003450BDD2
MFDHMLPTTPGALIGYRRNGQPIRLLAGGAKGGGDAAAGGDGEGQTSDAPAQAGTQSQEGQTSGSGTPDPFAAAKAAEQRVNPDAIKVDQLPDWAQKIVRDARKEAGDYRAQLKQAQQEREEAAKNAGPSPEELTAQVRTDFAQQIGKALGLVTEEEQQLTPEQVIEQLTTERDQTAKERDEERELRRRERLEAGVLRASGKLGADSEALLDSRTFLRKIRDLDPDADDFSAKLGDLIQLAIDENPKYKATALAATPKRSGGEFAGGPGARPSGSELTTDDFRKRRAAEAAVKNKSS